MENRARACGALIRDDAILMVQHQELGRTFWTLPGGAVEAGETCAEAAIREVFEETGIRTRAVRLLWTDGYSDPPSPNECHLLKIEEGRTEPELRVDPEEAHLPHSGRQLQGVAWKRLDEMASDTQVSRVLVELASAKP